MKRSVLILVAAILLAAILWVLQPTDGHHVASSSHAECFFAGQWLCAD